jgi:hypothetical protein
VTGAHANDLTLDRDVDQFRQVVHLATDRWEQTRDRAVLANLPAWKALECN